METSPNNYIHVPYGTLKLQRKVVEATDVMLITNLFFASTSIGMNFNIFDYVKDRTINMLSGSMKITASLYQKHDFSVPDLLMGI